MTIKIMAKTNLLSPSKVKGEILSSINGTSSPCELVRQLKVSFHGQILFKDPIIKPVKMAKIKFF